MNVLIAEKCGFCFGVKHAIQLAGEMLDQGKNVYCLGSLIHNQQVVDRLMDAGLKVVNDVSDIPTETQGEPTPTVLIRSHGCSPALLDEVRNRGLNLADATCVLVKRAQKLVKELHEQGYQVVVVGDPDHPEIRGVVGYAPNVVVVASKDDLAKVPRCERLAVISQTTHSAEDFGHLVGELARGDFHEIKVVNTICRETTRRQASALDLCQQVDVMFVLGSPHSANTGELANICRRQGVKTYHLQDWREFKAEFVAGKSTAGVTAGASTPDWIIQEFIENLKRL